MVALCYLLHQPMVRGVSAQLHVRTVAASLQPGLGHLQRVPLHPDGLLQSLHMLLLVVDLLHGLGEVGLELVVGVRGLLDPLLEGHVGVVPVTPHLVSALSDQIVHLASESLRGRSRS